MDHTDTGLRAIVKTLKDVVAPAVDPADPLAQEQLRLSIDYLEFLRGRLDWLHGRERFELHHHLTMARELVQLRAPVGPNTAAALSHAIAAGTDTIADPAASTPTLKAATAALAAAIAALVREAGSLEDGARRAVERCVLAASDERIAFERSWYLPLGFDISPGDVRGLAEYLEG